MKKTVLFPTDFSIQSLLLLRNYLDSKSNLESENILMLYRYFHDTLSITDLLFYNKTKIIQNYSSPLFNNALEIVKNKFESKINNLEIDVIQNGSAKTFINFTEGRKVTNVILPNRESYKSFSRDYTSLCKLILRSKFNIKCINVNSEDSYSKEQSLDLLFKSV